MTKTSAAEPQSLQALYTRPGFIIRRAGIDQISLGALIGADRSTVASVVRPLDDGGLVARCLVSNDRRRKQLRLPRAPVERPDFHVAWRGDALPSDVDALVQHIRGAKSEPV